MPKSLMLIIVVMIPSVITTGCGPSGRDLSDRQWLDLQKQLQDERAEVGRQRDQLETDRREWDRRQRRDMLLAESISAAGSVAGVLIPLILATVLLWPRPEVTPPEVCDVLIDQIITQSAGNLTGPGHLGVRAALPAPDQTRSRDDPEAGT